MSPRNYYFQHMHPEVAKEYHEELASFIPNVWKAIGKYSGLDKFFSFTPRQITNSTDSQEIDKPSNLL